MSDISCIYEMSLINESDTLKQDILNGKALDILLILLSGSKTVREMARELDIPSFSIQLYIKRLLEANLIKITDVKVVEGKVEKSYQLASSDIEILNHLKTNCKSDEGQKNVDLSAQYLASLTKEIIKGVDEYDDKPHKIKAYFIKADKEKMIEFKNDLDELFKKYQALENMDANDTYGFVSVFAPYKIK